MPLKWACSVAKRARKENRIKNDHLFTELINQIDKFRAKAGALLNYDWVPVPLVYTQVRIKCFIILQSNLFTTAILGIQEESAVIDTWSLFQRFAKRVWNGTPKRRWSLAQVLLFRFFNLHTSSAFNTMCHTFFILKYV